MVLIGCERSQNTASAFRDLGIEAYSCDIVPAKYHPEFHINWPLDSWLLDGDVSFQTQDGCRHYVDRWELIIAHPPCTYLTNAGSVRMFTHDGFLYPDRVKHMIEARDFFMMFLNSNCAHVCVENPTPMKICMLPPYSQVIQPYEFGADFSKRTLLWLKGLPKLKPTSYCKPSRHFMDLAHSDRDITYPGISSAMAHQWSVYCK